MLSTVLGTLKAPQSGRHCYDSDLRGWESQILTTFMFIHEKIKSHSNKHVTHEA